MGMLQIGLLTNFATIRRFALLLSPMRALPETEPAGCLVPIQSASCVAARNTTPRFFTIDFRGPIPNYMQPQKLDTITISGNISDDSSVGCRNPTFPGSGHSRREKRSWGTDLYRPLREGLHQRSLLVCCLFPCWR